MILKHEPPTDIHLCDRRTDSTDQSVMQILAMIACLICLTWYLFVSVKLTIVEALLASAGMASLWLPVASAVYVFTHDQFEHGLDRITFCVISSYALTTAFYFGLGVASSWLPGVERSFVPVLALIAVSSLFVAWRTGLLCPSARSPDIAKPTKFDWTLFLLLVISSLVTARYKSLFEYDPASRAYLLTTSADQTYFASLSYECLRHTPILETPYRAGQASRAYHMFPHLATALIGRFTFQPDLIRAHLIYEYTFIEWFMLLALFCLVRQFTESRCAGYLAVVVMFIGAIPTTRLHDDLALSYLYFCAWPQSSSMIDPVLITSPQQYSGCLITYGILLGISTISRRFSRNQPADRIAIVIGLLGGIMVRVRVQTFLPLFPAILAVFIYFLIKTRNKNYLIASAVSVGVALGLILEMHRPIYLPNTVQLNVGNSLLAFKYPHLNSWPGSQLLARNLMQVFARDSVVFQWIWQIISVTAFGLLNIIGIPVLFAINLFLRNQKSQGKFDGAALLIFWMVVASFVGSFLLTSSYDEWSVGGQMLLQTNWYLYPVAMTGLWYMLSDISKSITLPQKAGIGLAILIVAAAFVWQCIRPPGLLEQQIRREQNRITADELEALQYTRSHLPDDAVILSQPLLSGSACAFSGIGGRRAYLEYFPSIEQEMLQGPDDERSRQKRISDIWSANSHDEFCRLIPSMTTHIVECTERPLRFLPGKCLEREWTSSNGQVHIWKVVH